MWHDGVSKELFEFMDSIGTTANTATDAIKHQIDIEAEVFREALAKTVPKGKTKGLLKSLTKAQVTTRKNWYGYEITFAGSDKHGTPYQKIANILNYGSSTIKGTRFISRAIRKLRGMDDRIFERFERGDNEYKSWQKLR